MERTGRTSIAALVSLLLVAACGSATSGGASSTTSMSPFANPTAGPLRTYATIEELTRVLAPTCRWTINHRDDSGTDSAWCEPESLYVGLSHDPSVQTVEKLKPMVTDSSYVCGWWGMMLFSYALERTGGREMYSAAGVTPSDLPATTTSVDTPAGMLQGGNWWTTYANAEQGQRLTMASGGYLVPAPAGCPSESAAPTPGAATSNERTACSAAATAFLATLVTKGVPGVSVETVPERGPRPMDATTCMADYIAEADGARVEKSLTAYLTTLGYDVTRDRSQEDYVTIVVATAKGKPRLELQLPAPSEMTASPAPFEVLLADG